VACCLAAAASAPSMLTLPNGCKRSVIASVDSEPVKRAIANGANKPRLTINTSENLVNLINLRLLIPLTLAFPLLHHQIYNTITHFRVALYSIMLEVSNKATQNLDLAVSYLRSGELVAFPTETVYGLGADARNPDAIQKVFQAKGRPADHPLIVHIADAQQLSEWATRIPASAWLLAASFWPGPLTIILPKHPSVSALITGGQDTIALRIPKHPLTLELLRKFGSGLVGPSANKYGHVSPTLAAHVATDLGDAVAAIVDGGPCAIGIESTIIYLSNQQPVIMRQGAITAAAIEQILQTKVLVNSMPQTSIRTAGGDESHYAPNTPVYLLALNDIIAYAQQQANISVISLHSKPVDLATNIVWQQLPLDPVAYAHDLYANLRAHDQLNNTAILVEQVPLTISWAAINDRLTRASVKK